MVAVALLLTSITALILAGRSGLMDQRNAAADSTAPPIVSRHILFIDSADGVVRVVDSQGARTLLEYQPGEGSFVRGVMRTLARQRRAIGNHDNSAVELRQVATRHLQLVDPVTDTTLILNAFGPDNLAEFSRLLKADGQLGT